MPKFELPVAPSLNNAYANVRGRGRTKTKRHRNWIKEADAYYVLQGLQRATKTMTGYACKMRFPRNLRGDIDGRAKLILDWMVSRNLTIDDRHCKRLLLEYGEGDLVEIEVTAYETETIS